MSVPLMPSAVAATSSMVTAMVSLDDTPTWKVMRAGAGHVELRDAEPQVVGEVEVAEVQLRPALLEVDRAVEHDPAPRVDVTWTVSESSCRRSA